MPRPSNTEQRRAQIIRGMRHVIAKEGYERATIPNIAKAAKLAPGLVHYHFKNKLEILEQLAVDLVKERLALLDRKLEKSPTLAVFIDHHLHPGDDADPEALACWIVLTAEALREPRIKRAVALGMHELLARAQTLTNDVSVAAGLVALIQGYYAVAAAVPSAIPKGSAHTLAKRLFKAYE